MAASCRVRDHLGDVHAEGAVDARALEAHECAVRDRGPRRVLCRAVEADLTDLTEDKTKKLILCQEKRGQEKGRTFSLCFDFIFAKNASRTSFGTSESGSGTSVMSMPMLPSLATDSGADSWRRRAPGFQMQE